MEKNPVLADMYIKRVPADSMNAKYFNADFSAVIDKAGLSKYQEKTAYEKQMAHSTFAETPGW